MRIGLWIITIPLIAATALSQERGGMRRSPLNVPEQERLIERRHDGQQEYGEVFHAVQQGISGGNVGAFSRHFSPRVYLSLPKGESGYYSGNQAHYILQNYFSGRSIQSFTLKYAESSDSAPYATGQGRSEIRGSVEDIRVYVSLSKLGSRWMVTQLTIY